MGQMDIQAALEYRALFGRVFAGNMLAYLARIDDCGHCVNGDVVNAGIGFLPALLVQPEGDGRTQVERHSLKQFGIGDKINRPGPILRMRLRKRAIVIPTGCLMHAASAKSPAIPRQKVPQPGIPIRPHVRFVGNRLLVGLAQDASLPFGVALFQPAIGQGFSGCFW